MSADKFRDCPQCALRKKNRAGEAKAALGHASGLDLPFSQIEPLQKAVADAEAMPIGDIPEFQEIWLNKENVFHFQVAGDCSVCGFGYNIQHSQAITVKP